MTQPMSSVRAGTCTYAIITICQSVTRY
jgi:hypothetical protein